MYSKILTFLILVSSINVLFSDINIKIRHQADGYYYGGIDYPEVDVVYDLWFSDSRMSFISEKKIINFDYDNGLLDYIILGDSTFVESTLPALLTQLVSEDLGERLEVYRRIGDVRQGSLLVKMDEKNCRCYEMHDWIPAGEIRYDERKTRFWATKDVPFDWKKFHEMYCDFLKMQNYGEELLQQIRSIEGCFYKMESTIYEFGFSRKETTHVIEISEKHPPAGVYMVADGFRKKDALTIQDLQD